MSEKFTGVTFAKQKVTPSDDAIIRRAILPDGILTGCELSYSGSTLTMAAGHLMICGRQIRMPSVQNWAIVDSTSGFARLVLTIDLTRTATKETFDQVVDLIEYASAEDGFVALDQTDINLSGTRYQIAVCVVSLGTGGITGIVSQLGKSAIDGSGTLNFNVVGGLTQPSNPKENTIWVNTSQKITSWMFSANEPAEHSEGMVWFTVGASSQVSFNALKKNGIEVYPIAAKQYVSGTWVSVDAKTRKNGEWVAWWDGYLYRPGNKYEDVTGGWTQTIATGGTITETAEGWTLSYSSRGGNGTVYSTGKKIDLTNVSTIEAILEDFSATNNAYFGIGVSLEQMTDYDSITNGASFNSVKAGTSCVVNVATLDGEYYVYFGIKSAWSDSVTSKLSGTLTEIRTVDPGTQSASTYQEELQAAYQEGVNSV